MTMIMSELDVVDFHAHILPCADHGSDSINTSLKQLNLAKKHGVKRIIATPHFYPHRHTLAQFLRKRDSAYHELKKHLQPNMPTVKLGAEVLVCPKMDTMESLASLCIEGTNVILLELPFGMVEDSIYETIKNLLAQDFKIVIAHADRYAENCIDKLISFGCKVQLNANAIDTLFKKKHIYNWAESSSVVAIGSDIHNVDKSAYKHFSRAINKFDGYIADIKSSSDKIWNSQIEALITE